MTVFLIVYTVVPGRILDMIAITSANLLRMKQIFVRYVSHEIRYDVSAEIYHYAIIICDGHILCRSPLNVVHVGLEMLVSVINSAGASAPSISIDRSTADFVLQMFFSSESAINILNDLLHYEHIEAGIHYCL